MGAVGLNHQLQQLMNDAGFSNKSLARAVQAAAARHGRRVGTDHTRVAGWLRGTTPRGETARYVVDAFTTRLGTPVTLADLGLGQAADMRPNLGLVYEASLTQAVSTLAELTQHDSAGHPEIVSGEYSWDALNALCLDWLFGESRADTEAQRRPIRSVDVIELQTMTATFDTLDRTFSGEHHRQLAVAYLKDVVVPKLAEYCDDAVGREFLRATAVLCELIGWMAYDTLHHSAAQRYFAQAVRFAQASGDEGYAAYAVSSMADQALFLGRPQQALRLAHVARSRTGQHVASLALTEAYVFEARAHALMGEKHACERALGNAEETFGRLTPNDLPVWGKSWSHVVLASHAGTCWTDLSCPDLAAPQIDTLWLSLAEGQPRRRVYSAVQLSRIALLRNDIEESTHYATLAADASPDMGSLRSVEHLDRQVQNLIAIHRDHPIVRSLAEKVVELRAE